jgi:hypothetical protein
VEVNVPTVEVPTVREERRIEVNVPRQEAPQPQQQPAAPGT